MFMSIILKKLYYNLKHKNQLPPEFQHMKYFYARHIDSKTFETYKDIITPQIEDIKYYKYFLRLDMLE